VRGKKGEGRTPYPKTQIHDLKCKNCEKIRPLHMQIWKKENTLEIYAIHSMSLALLHKFHEQLFVHETNKVAFSKNTDVSQAQFHEALIDQIDGRVDIESNRGLARES
jgi:hypothetical protein